MDAGQRHAILGLSLACMHACMHALSSLSQGVFTSGLACMPCLNRLCMQCVRSSPKRNASPTPQLGQLHVHFSWRCMRKQLFCARLPIQTHIRAHACMHTCMRTMLLVPLCMHACIYVCMHACSVVARQRLLYCGRRQSFLLEVYGQLCVAVAAAFYYK